MAGEHGQNLDLFRGGVEEIRQVRAHLDRVRTGARLGTAPGEPAGAPLEGLGIDPDGSAGTDGKRQG